MQTFIINMHIHVTIVVTHFWVPTKNKNKKPKEVRKITGGRSAQKMVGKLVKEVKNTKI